MRPNRTGQEVSVKTTEDAGLINQVPKRMARNWKLRWSENTEVTNADKF